MPARIEILPFTPAHAVDVARLIVGIQRDEFGIDITAAQQPDLSDIPGFYQVGAGHFWVAVDGARVVGTIALLDIGQQQVALRKMFVNEEFRGQAAGTAFRLLTTALLWAREKHVREIFLGTTAKFTAAHRFYEKHEFVEVSRGDLPEAFPIMAVDTKFYRRILA